MRRKLPIVAFVAFVALAACSGDDPASTVPPRTDATVDVGDSLTTTDPEQRRASTTVPEANRVVSIAADIDGETVEFSGELAAASDPFGEFVSCSGGRAWFTTYSLLASRTAGDVRSLSVVTNDLVGEPGIHDAMIRVEYANAEAQDAAGTMTVDDGYRTGSFTAFTDGGALISGTFSCGLGATPMPLEVGDDDGQLEAVDAVALLRNDRGERLVSLAVDTATDASVRCAAGDGSDEDVLVLVDAGAEVGSISSLELTGGTSPTLRMRVGSTDYVYDDVTVSEAGSAGTFSATGEVSVDGAWRCS